MNPIFTGHLAAFIARKEDTRLSPRNSANGWSRNHCSN